MKGCRRLHSRGCVNPVNRRFWELSGALVNFCYFLKNGLLLSCHLQWFENGAEHWNNWMVLFGVASTRPGIGVCDWWSFAQSHLLQKDAAAQGCCSHCQRLLGRLVAVLATSCFRVRILSSVISSTLVTVLPTKRSWSVFFYKCEYRWRWISEVKQEKEENNCKSAVQLFTYIFKLYLGMIRPRKIFIEFSSTVHCYSSILVLIFLCS